MSAPHFFDITSLLRVRPAKGPKPSGLSAEARRYVSPCRFQVRGNGHPDFLAPRGRETPNPYTLFGNRLSLRLGQFLTREDRITWYREHIEGKPTLQIDLFVNKSGNEIIVSLGNKPAPDYLFEKSPLSGGLSLMALIFDSISECVQSIPEYRGHKIVFRAGDENQNKFAITDPRFTEARYPRMGKGSMPKEAYLSANDRRPPIVDYVHYVPRLPGAGLAQA